MKVLELNSTDIKEIEATFDNIPALARQFKQIIQLVGSSKKWMVFFFNRNRYKEELFKISNTIFQKFRLAKPAFFRYNENTMILFCLQV